MIAPDRVEIRAGVALGRHGASEPGEVPRAHRARPLPPELLEMAVALSVGDMMDAVGRGEPAGRIARRLGRIAGQDVVPDIAKQSVEAVDMVVLPAIEQ